MTNTNDRLPHGGARCIEEESGDARSIILRRRARFLALALAAVQTGASACGGKSVCLTPSFEGNRGGSGAAVGCLQPPGGNYPCLTILAGTGGVPPGPCLSGRGPCLSGGSTSLGGAGGEGGDGLGFGGWQVCLSPPPPGGAGGVQGGFGPCLSGSGGLGGSEAGSAGAETGGSGGDTGGSGGAD